MARAKRIMQVVAYDIQKDRNRKQVSDLLEKYGTRVNRSVFECMITAVQLRKLKSEISTLVDKRTDIIIFYTVCINCYTKTTYLPDSNKDIESISFV